MDPEASDQSQSWKLEIPEMTDDVSAGHVSTAARMFQRGLIALRAWSYFDPGSITTGYSIP